MQLHEDMRQASKEKLEDSIIRVQSIDIANELMELAFGKDAN